MSSEVVQLQNESCHPGHQSSWIITDTDSFLLNNGFYFSLNKFHCFIVTVKTYTFQFKCRLFSKHANKTEQILVRKHEANQDFHHINTGKTIVKTDIITMQNILLQCKSNKAVTQNNWCCSEDPTKSRINSSLFADKPNSPVKAAGRAPVPRQGKGQRRFPSPWWWHEDDSPQKNVPHVGVPILQSNIALPGPPRTMGMAQLGHSLLTAVPTQRPPICQITAFAKWAEEGQAPPNSRALEDALLFKDRSSQSIWTELWIF